MIWMIFLTLFLTSCGKKEVKTSSQQILRVNMAGEPNSIIPHHDVDMNCQILQKNIYDGLTRIYPDRQPHLATADSVTVSDDQLRYIFHLRPSKWSNGENLSAYDFEWAWKRALTPGSDCVRSDLFFVIKNARAAKKGELPLDAIGIEALDASTLSVTLEHPAPYFLRLVACTPFSPLLKGPDGDPLDLGNGPFRIADWETGQQVVLERNPHYWDATSVKLDEIQISFVNDPNTSLLLYEKGETDWAGSPFTTLPLDALPRLSSVVDQSMAGVFWFYCNTEKVPFNSSKIRRALSYALNRQAISNHVLLGEPPTRSIFPSCMQILSPEELHPDDLFLARKLFDEGLAELQLTKDQLHPLKLSHSDIPAQKKIAEIAQRQWEEAFGIEIELECSEWQVFSNKLQKRNFEIGGCVIYVPFQDPAYLLEIFQDRHIVYNYTHWENPLFSELLKMADSTLDPLERKECLREAERLLLTEMPIIPLYSRQFRYVKNSTVHDAFVNDDARIDFKWAWRE